MPIVGLIILFKIGSYYYAKSIATNDYNERLTDRCSDFIMSQVKPKDNISTVKIKAFKYLENKANTESNGKVLDIMIDKCLSKTIPTYNK